MVQQGQQQAGRAQYVVSQRQGSGKVRPCHVCNSPLRQSTPTKKQTASTPSTTHYRRPTWQPVGCILGHKGLRHPVEQLLYAVRIHPRNLAIAAQHTTQLGHDKPGVVGTWVQAAEVPEHMQDTPPAALLLLLLLWLVCWCGVCGCACVCGSS